MVCPSRTAASAPRLKRRMSRSIGEEGRRQGVARLRQQGPHIAERVFDPSAVEAGGETHVAALDGDVEPAEQPPEMRIGRVVEDDEARVHRLVAAPPGNHRAGVAAEAGLGFEERHLRLFVKHERGRQAGDTAPDDGDALLADAGVEGHACSPASS